MKARTLEAAKNPESSDPFLAIRSEREYDAAVARLDALVDEVGDNSKAPRYRLIETLSVLVEAYDREHDSLPEASGLEVLRLLIEEYGLTQTDLPEIGSQDVVSGVLAGRAVSTCGKYRRTPRALGLIRGRLSTQQAPFVPFLGADAIGVFPPPKRPVRTKADDQVAPLAKDRAMEVAANSVDRYAPM